MRKWKTEAGDERRQIPYAAWRLMLLYAGVVSLRDGLTVGYNVGPVKLTSLDAFKARASALPFGHPDYRPPEPYEVTALTELAGWSQVRTAKLVGVKSDPKKGSTTVRKWKTEKGDERRQIPYAAWRLMLLYAGVVTLDDEYLHHVSRVADRV